MSRQDVDPEKSPLTNERCVSPKDDEEVEEEERRKRFVRSYARERRCCRSINDLPHESFESLKDLTDHSRHDNSHYFCTDTATMTATELANNTDSSGNCR